jgi:galactofuranosylgalactofuranosylrhamnosyl-N-acetylglucosaminyl-diphospho-decaprenol beta-1,5/1,6-galactofuranosyltransferase
MSTPASRPAVPEGAAAGGEDVRVLQRVVFPTQGNLDIVTLYVETKLDQGPSLGLDLEDVLEDALEKKGSTENAEMMLPAAVATEAQSAVRFGIDGQAVSAGDIAGRRSAVVAANRRVSFGAYFNAFPASYWRRWSVIDQVLLRIRVAGEGTIIVYRSTARGQSHPVESITFDTDGPQDFQLELPLNQFIDGGWYWFDIAAGGQDATLYQADWAARTDRLQSGRLSIGITTYNRPDFCVDGLRVLGEAPEVLDILDHVYVVDQGTQHVEDHPEFAEGTKGLADKLDVIRQGNLGGSGGFSRAMDATLRAGTSDYVLLLDDDVITEPESMLRAIAFADLARRPTIVGGHMFSLYDRSVLHAFGETVNPYNFWWGSAPRTKQGHDFGRRSLRNTPWLHRRVDVDYNGWWMCLIPTAAVRELGLALPVFIKWDDAEYGLRAGAAGFPTVSLPGVAIWHVPWQDKNDALDWQAYYHLRNRLVAALLHSPYEHGGSVVTENFEHQIRHLLAMQYSTATLRLMAMEDILFGPEHLHRDIATKRAQLGEVLSQFPDASTRPDIERFPAVKRRKPPRRGKEPTSPKNPVSLILRAAVGALRQVRPVDALALEHPQAVVPSQDAEWWRLSVVDSALVSTADGTSTSWYQRDPAQFRSLLQRSVQLHARMVRDWPRLREQYRAAAPGFTSPEAWRATFETQR